MIVFVDVLGLGIVIPVLPLFAQNQMAAVAWQITALTSLYFAAQFFAGPVLGRLSDRFGRRPVLILSQAGTLAAHLITGSATTLAFLYASRLIDGITGGNFSVAQAYLSDITEEKDRARGLGIVNAAFGLGFVFGPAFGSLVASLYGPRVPFFAAAGVSLFTILLTVFLLPESLPPERRQREQAPLGPTGQVSDSRAIRPSRRYLGHGGSGRWIPRDSSRGPGVTPSANPSPSPGEVRREPLGGLTPRGRGEGGGLDVIRIPAVTVLLTVGFLSQFAFFSFQTIYVLWAERLVFPNLPETQVQQAIGGILTFVGVCGIVTQFWLVGPFVKRFGEKKLVAAGNLSRAGSFALMAISPHALASVIAVPFLAIGGGLALPATIALLTYASPPGARGQVIGLYQSAAAFGSIVGPILAGFLFEQVNPNAPMVAASLVMSLAALLALQVFRMPIGQIAG
jgi:DHA1 family tetracycline resistance protein-like MFS transporter